MDVPVLSRYRIGNLEVDAGRRSIRRDGREEHPRARVFDLLLYLLENRERPVTKQELVDRVWGGVAVTDSVLYKTVLELRRVLGDDPESPVYVKTLPKLGYQFVAMVEADTPAAAPAEPLPPAEEIPVRPRAAWRWWVPIVVLTVAGAALWVWQSGQMGPPTVNEIAWWRFDDGQGLAASDTAGRNAGRLLPAPAGGAPPHWARGRSASALSLGGGNFVQGELTAPEWSAMTVAAWVQPRDTIGADSTIFDSFRFRFLLTPVGIQLTRQTSAGAVQRPEHGRWRHVVAVDEGPLTGVGRVYVNGSEVGSGVLAPGKEWRGKWRIGNSFSGNAPFRGLIDDVRVYARPLRPLEIEAIYRCGKEAPDNTASGRGFYYLPVFAGAAVRADGAVENGSKDFGGIQFGAHGGNCGVADLRGADLGQDLRISMDLDLTIDAEGHTTEGGPYFRSRRAYPGDGIAGGTSSGYWVKVGADGHIRVWQLRPYHAIASATLAGFEAKRTQRIEAEARGNELHVWVDGVLVRFEQDGRVVEAVAIEATAAGMGTAGVAFSADRNRGSLGGQRFRNLGLEILAK